MKDLMIDLETLGTRVNAPIVAVGACFFDINTGNIGKTFEAVMDLSLVLRYGRMDGDTLKWWLGQSDDARQKLVRGRSDPLKVYPAFVEFVSAGGDGVRPWGNGASFDISMLEYTLARVMERRPPWDFWNIRDCRTIKHVASDLKLPFAGERKGTHHSALDDAVFQAEWVSAYWQQIMGKTTVPVQTDDDLMDLLA